MNTNTHTQKTGTFPTVVLAGLPVMVALAVFSLVMTHGDTFETIIQREGVKGLPIPFMQQSAPNPFAASLQQTGVSGGAIKVYLVELSDTTPADQTQHLSDDSIYLVRTAATETVAFDMAFSPVGGHIPDYFFYKYSDSAASAEIAHQSAATFGQRFPGVFGASAQAWVNEVEQGNGIDFLATDTSTGSVHFEPNALYAMIVNESGGATINLHAAVICGDGWKATTEQCDDHNVISGDGCSVTCTTEVTSSSSSSSISSVLSSSSISSSSSVVSSSSESSSLPASSSSSSAISSTQSSSLSSSSSSAYDIILTHDETGKVYYGPAASDLERGDLLRQAVATLQNGDTLLLSAGRFDIDCKNKGNLRLPNNIAVIGAGMDQTRLYGNCLSDDQGSAFEIRSGSFADLAFENQSWDATEDGRTIQMYDGTKRTANNVGYEVDPTSHAKIYEQTNVPAFSATFDRVKFIGTAWVVYDWSSPAHTWTIRDSVVVSARQGVSIMSSGGAAKNVTILRTYFDIDTMRSRDIGWTSNRLVGGGYAVVARTGHVTVTDSEFHMKCGTTPSVSSFAPRCVGIYDGNDFDSTSSPWTYITLTNNKWFINGNGSVDTYDMMMTNQPVIDKLIINGGVGSGAGGALTKNW